MTPRSGDDPEFASAEEMWESIPEAQRPRRDRPFYHVLAENELSAYHAYVAEQNLLGDESGQPLQNPNIAPRLAELFDDFDQGAYHLRQRLRN